ncbi:MAG TPA: GreA/GreB family elongation factor [Patescibacteria group bacterium]|nr:GreA/GreB family elongation factor [Patescibacteria group bacterium]
MIPFTAKYYQHLKDEVIRLHTLREEVVGRLAIAREQGDLSENGAYKYAKMELGDIGRQLRELHRLLFEGKIVEHTHPGVVEFGATVTLVKDKKPITYVLVSAFESDPAAHKLSIDSPLGLTLLGKKKGDMCELRAPAGMIQYDIQNVD